MNESDRDLASSHPEPSLDGDLDSDLEADQDADEFGADPDVAPERTFEPDGEGVRLQKVLSAAGVASRRAAEIMIDRGRVEVNGRVVTEQGMRVNPERDTIRVDGSRIPGPRRHRYLVLNKPRGVISTMSDPEDRPNLGDYLGPRLGRLYHVGRLDGETEGLIVLTNDGEFAHRLAHPSFAVTKTYLAEVEGILDKRTLEKLRTGVKLDDGPVHPESVKVIDRGPTRTLVRISLKEGRNRIVRRIFETIGHPVRKLSRIQIGPIRLGDLRTGETRDLTREELGALLDLVGL